jgi:hypothetical protein
MIYVDRKCDSCALIVHAKCQAQQLCYMPGNPVMTHFISRQEPNVLDCPVSKKKEVSHLVYKTDDSPKSPLALQHHCSQVIIKPSTFNTIRNPRRHVWKNRSFHCRRRLGVYRPRWHQT